MNKYNLLQNLVDPLLSRLGTAAATGLVGYGMAENHATVVGSALTLLAGFGVDLLTRKYLKR